jgi:farnesyl diphosphate synthase
VTAASTPEAVASGLDTATGFDTWARSRAARVEQALGAVLPPESTLPATLHTAMRYAVLGGGKRVRPLLVYAAGELAGASAEVLDHPACAVELVHAYSLVHDDLPCMDDDVLRRGKPTVHVAFGEATAMLAGDALQALAFESVVRAGLAGAAAQAIATMVGELARAAGSLGMAGGQAIDLEAVGRSLDRTALEGMHRRKTGAMLRASVMMGAACGRLPEGDALQRLSDYADAVGLAFQVVDDVLDVEADSATLGKTAGKDAAHDKPTYVSVIGLEASRALALSLREDALRAIAPLGPAAGRLRELADLIVLRRS